MPHQPFRSRARTFLADRLDPKAYLGLHVTAGIIIAVLGVALFGTLVDAVLDNKLLVDLDLGAAALIHERVSPRGLMVFDAITQFGSPVTMASLAAIGAVLIAYKRHWTLLITWLAAFGGGVIIDQVLKNKVGRNRPAYGTAYLHGHSYSFPSGHAMGSIVGYTMLVYAVLLFWHPRKSRRHAAMSLAGIIVFLIGVSRVYIGVHYPSDVLGGFAAGAAWVAVCISGYGIAVDRRRARDAARGASTPVSV